MLNSVLEERGRRIWGATSSAGDVVDWCLLHGMPTSHELTASELQDAGVHEYTRHPTRVAAHPGVRNTREWVPHSSATLGCHSSAGVRLRAASDPPRECECTRSCRDGRTNLSQPGVLQEAIVNPQRGAGKKKKLDSSAPEFRPPNTSWTALPPALVP
ncbi:hypothetical protein BDZ89DRAFT_1051139 [Hymenopellis radicata]|nr:hypothetical protein BDZ89DRAFT_1051139 [Hymenopellis radicata]